MKRRGMLFGLISLASVPFVGRVADASVRDATLWSIEPSAMAEKPVTTEGLARTLLGQADKVRKQGLVAEAKILREAAMKLLALPGKIGVLPCDTDSDCERKNPHLRGDGGGDDPLDLRRNLESY